MKLWKVQKLFSDVVYDLRSRNLMPIALLLVGAIIAVPFLISKTGGESTAPAVTDPAAQNASELAPENQKAVLAYDPGVRNYRSRLKELSSKNPFIQQFAAPAAAASALDQAVDTGGTGGSTEDGIPDLGGTVPDGSGGSGGGGGGGKKKGKTKTKTRYFFYETDVSAGESGGTLTPYADIQQFTSVPSSSVPVAVFLGVTSGGSQAIFLVSKDVTSVGGSGTCFPSATSCQLLGLGSGAGADLVYGPDGKTYHVQVDGIKRVSSSKPPN